ncbi:MAG: translation elongation factor Ts [Phycisphaerales bacterium]|nr:translation elongation factor Ts [Phycisphaerales bacterium]
MTTNAPISASDINKLRQTTGAGMLDCRKALTETNGNFEAAIDWLRKQGQKVAAKRSDRETKEGVVLALTNTTNTIGYIVCVSCETDFVSKNAEFITFVKSIMQVAIDRDPKNIDDLLQLKIGGATVQDLINDKLTAIGERISVSKYERLESPFVSAYIHGANRIGVLVGLSGQQSQLGKDLAMQIAAMNPIAVDRASVSNETIEREKAIAIETIQSDPKMAGKPADMISKIADGKLTAFFKEQTLLSQPFVKNGAQTVGDYIVSVQSDLKVSAFKRIAIGS